MSELKKQAALAALAHVRSRNVVGLGTGSTADEFVRALADRLRLGTLSDITGVPTSRATESLAQKLGIPLRLPSEVDHIDVTVDGADEIDGDLRLIKGRGGALLREKIVEQASRVFVVIADESKLVDRLGRGPLPVEVIPFAADLLVRRMASAGLDPQPRKAPGGWFRSDSGNCIVDVLVGHREVADVHTELKRWAGVIETGFFATEATEAIIASPSGIQRMVRT